MYTNNIAVTLSMPVYKSEKYIRKAFMSALNQDFDNMEILIIDNGSADKSLSIIEEIISDYKGCKVINFFRREKNIGIGDARNIAISHAQGKYLFFMDSDDEITSDCISKLYKAMQEFPVDFVASSYDKVNNLFVSTLGYLYEDRKLDSSREILTYFFKKKRLSVTVWNKLYDISFLRKENICCIPTHINEDALFSVKLFLRAKSCRLLSDITLHYHIYNNSFNQANKINWTYEYIIQICEIVEHYFQLLSNEYNRYKRGLFITWLLKYIMYLIIKIQKSTMITPDDKKNFISGISRIPINLNDVKYLFLNIDSSLFLFGTLMIFPYKMRIFLLMSVYKIRHI